MKGEPCTKVQVYAGYAEIGLASGSLHPPFLSLTLSLALAEWLSLSFSVTRSPQLIKCGELVVNFSLQHTNTLNSLGWWGSDCVFIAVHTSAACF